MCAIPEIIVLMPLIWKVWVKSMIVIQWITEHMSECTWMTQWMCEWTSECWHHSSESYTQRYAPFCVSSRVTVRLQLFKSCTGSQSLSGSSTSCACWFTSRFWDTRRNISQTFWHRLPIFQVDLHCVLHRAATLSCRGHVNELATKPVLLLHREHGAGYRRSWNCCDRRTCFVVIWKHFCFILSIDSVMCPRSSSRGHNTSASVTVTVTVKKWMSEWII